MSLQVVIYSLNYYPIGLSYMCAGVCVRCQPTIQLGFPVCEICIAANQFTRVEFI